MMQNPEIDRYRAALEARQIELLRALRDRQAIAIEKAPDTLDEVQLSTERELAISKLDRESDLLHRVQAALARLEDDSYGICLRCEQPISKKRLDAVPWAAYCVRCQEEVDKQAGAAGLHGLLDDAA